MELAPYLTLYGRCEEALAFYKAALGGTYELMKFEGTPAADGVPEAWRSKVMHATFTFGENEFMASDGRPGSKPPDDANVSLSLGMRDEAEAKRLFAALSAGGKVDMPLEKQFWGATFGAFYDKFGIYWMINAQST